MARQGRKHTYADIGLIVCLSSAVGLFNPYLVPAAAIVIFIWVVFGQ